MASMPFAVWNIALLLTVKSHVAPPPPLSVCGYVMMTNPPQERRRKRRRQRQQEQLKACGKAVEVGEEEREAVLKYCVGDMNLDLYRELMDGLRLR